MHLAHFTHISGLNVFQYGLGHPAHKEILPQKFCELFVVQKKSGIYAYVLDGDEHHWGIRTFDDNTKREVYERQQGICPICHTHFEIEQMEADHITPWHAGGRTIAENCQMLCKECNRRKGGI